MKNITLTLVSLCTLISLAGCQTTGIDLDTAYQARHTHCDKYVQEKWQLQHDGKLNNDDANKINLHLHSLLKK